MPAECVANFDTVHTVRQGAFRQRTTKLDGDKLHEACQALNQALGCI
ncbi:hypothetical protein BH24ACT3_BH24ACT3_18250 [soil metagenome]